MGGEVKEVFTSDLKGYIKWLVFDNSVYVDKNYLDELFSQELCLA